VPTLAARLRQIARRLRRAYGVPPAPRRLAPLDELVLTILSQNTADVNSHRAFVALRARYPTWEAVLEARTEIAEIRFSMPNKHHFAVDLKPFGLENDNEVFYAADRPYGLIEGTVTRDGVAPADQAW